MFAVNFKLWTTTSWSYDYWGKIVWL